jgi:hypothetical protein
MNLDGMLLGSEDPRRLTENHAWTATFSDPDDDCFQLTSRIPS